MIQIFLSFEGVTAVYDNDNLVKCHCLGMYIHCKVVDLGLWQLIIFIYNWYVWKFIVIMDNENAVQNKKANYNHRNPEA